MNKFYSSKSFQFFSIVIISSLCVLLNSLTVINFHKIDIPRASPQYNATGINASVYSASGKLIYNLQSKSALEYPDQDKIYLQQLQIKVHDESSDAVEYYLNANSAWVNRITKDVFLQESVAITINNDNLSKAIHISGNNIKILANKNYIYSAESIIANQGKSSVFSKGFSYDGKQQMLLLESAVKIVYYK
ncbi:MAG: LPS export ABC transporter periplasmic protein LptC [Burkholderiales bacterium]|nr:LPS export ABC transporter periplasmic protein LptC [Burkholderiales bacterium]